VVREVLQEGWADLVRIADEVRREVLARKDGTSECCIRCTECSICEVYKERGEFLHLVPSNSGLGAHFCVSCLRQVGYLW